MGVSRWEDRAGRDTQESLARELLEELAIKVRIGEFLCNAFYQGDGVSLELLVYSVERVEGEPALIEHQELRWVRPDELSVFDLADSDRKVVERLYG